MNQTISNYFKPVSDAAESSLDPGTNRSVMDVESGSDSDEFDEAAFIRLNKDDHITILFSTFWTGLFTIRAIM